MKRFGMLLYLLSAGLFAAPYTEIQDTANLPLLAPDLADIETAKIALPNGLQVFLISDPKADQSAAVVSVDVGSWSDAPEYPGMAHFCEHMLFMGTQKYPDSNEFSTLVSDYNGKTNAFTAADKTVYMFSSNTEGFLPLLDHFAHFFIDPIFDPSNISREMIAVDQEFSLMKENDGWRAHMVFKEMGNKEHPNHQFSAGNSQTLSKIPQSALKKWHGENYGAQRMRLAIYSNLSLSDLKESASEMFSSVPKNSKAPPNFAERISSEGQKGMIISVKPIKNLQSVRLCWELPTALALDDSKSAELVAYCLQRAHEKSLTQKLKNEGLIDSLGVYLSSSCGVEHPMFEASFALTDKGMENIEPVISYFFQALQGLKETGIDEALFVEKNALNLKNYQYQSRVDAFSLVQEIGSSISDENLASYPRRTLLGSHFDPQKVQKTLDFLQAKNCMITVLSQKGSIYNKKEKWLEVPYGVQAAPIEWIEKWEASASHPEITPPPVNPFVTDSFSIIPSSSQAQNPHCIASSDSGLAYYARCPEFGTPEGRILLEIATPMLNQTSRSQVLATLYLNHLNDLLGSTRIEAGSAGLNSAFDISRFRISLDVTGFSEKLPLLLAKIVEKMPENPPTIEDFERYVSRLTRYYESRTKDLPVRQAGELLSSILTTDKTTSKENLSALRKITFEDFYEFHKRLFEKAYFEALFAGNFSMQTAESAWVDILHSLSKSPYLKKEHLKIHSLHLPETEGPFRIVKETRSQGHATILLIDEGDYSEESEAVQTLLGMSLEQPFFDTLRTKQKTGYIASSGVSNKKNRLFQYFLVQSNTHEGEDLLHRYELFLEEAVEDFGNLVSEERFETLKTSAVNSLKKGPRNLTEKSDRLFFLTFEKEGDFTLFDRKIEALEALDYNTFKEKASSVISRSNKKRLAILYKGQLPDPFTYTNLKSSEISKYTKDN